jgi:hypothetical protein
MKCQACGVELGTNAKFCWKCGAPATAGGGSFPKASATGTDQPPGVALGFTVDAVRDALRRVALLDGSVFAEIREDVTLTVPALLVAAIAMSASALGGFLWSMVEFEPDSEFFWKTVLLGTVFGLLFWGIAVGAIFMMLRSIVKIDVKMDEVLRVAGFATAPLGIGLFIFIPEIAFGIGLLSVSLFLALLVVALHTAFDVSVDKALLAVLPGFAIWVLILPLLATTENPFGPGVFVFDWAQDALADVYKSFSPFR